ncbi:MAG: hypothetical protein H7318_13445 [Oligoflexus sp.]|nr:hypothetical protein [Oligoflexus sp.]
MIGLALTAALLFGPGTPQAERQQILSKIFEPKPESLLDLDRLSMLENEKNPERMQGKIWVNPPKGQCLIVRTGQNHRDKRYCKRSAITWSIDELDGLGFLNLIILIEAEWDDGVLLKWKTNYRIGNFVGAGDKVTGDSQDIVIKTCKATEVDGDRSILLESFEGRRWRINLPEYDKPVRDIDPTIPNLMVNIDSKKNADGSVIDKKAEEEKKVKEEEAAKAGEHGAKPEDKKDAKKPAAGGGGSVLGALLSKGYQATETTEIKYNLPQRSAFKMESGMFTETGSPKGMNGECRYMFKNAPGDPESGAIECHDTDTLDNVYVHVTCFSQLRTRLKKSDKANENKPEKNRDKEGKKP